MAEHLGHSDEGAARFMTDTNLQKYGIGQRDGTAFVIPAAEANALEAAAAGSATKLEKALGLPEGLLQNNNLVRVDIPKPRELDLRMPSGNEAGANGQWIPGGGREAVISVGRLEAGQYSTRVVAGRGGNSQIDNVEAGATPSGDTLNLRYPVATNPNEVFFWSGRTNGVGGEAVARGIAESQSGGTLEALIENRAIQMPKWNATDPAVVLAWKDQSVRLR